MKSKKRTQKARKSGKASLKTGVLGKLRTLRLASNHNETLVRNS